MSKIQYYLRRTVITVVLIWAVATFLFFAFRLMPGDYATLLAGQGADADQLEAIRDRWGLNDPLYVQYFDYMMNLATGDAGVSHQTNQPVFEFVGVRLMNSLILVLPAILTAFVLGSIYGTILGTTSRPLLEKYGIIPPTVAGTTPGFFAGIILIIIFSGYFGLFPSSGIASLATHRDTDSIWELYMTRDFLRHYALPFLTIVVTFLYYPTLVMRGSVVEIRGQEFSYYQRIMGLGSRTRFKHIMKHASLPVITLLPASTATAISGLVVIEWVFNWPGIGILLFDAVLNRDVPVLQVLFLIVAIWIIVGNYIVDIMYTVIDPRITYEEE